MLTCVGVVPGRQADGLLQEAELRVVEAEGLVHHVRRGLHVDLADGHGFTILGPERHLWSRRWRVRAGQRLRHVHRSDSAIIWYSMSYHSQ